MQPFYTFYTMILHIFIEFDFFSRPYNRYVARNWTDIVAIAASNHAVGLKADGTVVAVGQNTGGQCNIQVWKLFNNFAVLEQERAEIKKRTVAERIAQQQRIKAEHQQKIAALEEQKKTLQAELSNCKGLFSVGKRKGLETRLAQIEKELSEL